MTPDTDHSGELEPVTDEPMCWPIIGGGCSGIPHADSCIERIKRDGLRDFTRRFGYLDPPPSGRTGAAKNPLDTESQE